MFSFFKSSIEKDLIKLGYESLINGYKQKVKSKEWTNSQFKLALKELHKKHQSEINNLNNVNVATRQSFDVIDTIPPLNLENIQQEFIDYDFIYSTLLFEYNNYKRIHTKAIYELDKLLSQEYPDAEVLKDEVDNLKNLSLKELINEATTPFSNEKKHYLKTVFKTIIVYS